MMTPDTFGRIQAVVKETVDDLVRENYCALEHRTKGIRLSASQLQSAVVEYGRTLSELPPDALKGLDVVEVRNVLPPTFSVWVGLWTIEEGRSDLTLELTLIDQGPSFDVEIDNLHVL